MSRDDVIAPAAYFHVDPRLRQRPVLPTWHRTHAQQQQHKNSPLQINPNEPNILMRRERTAESDPATQIGIRMSPSFSSPRPNEQQKNEHTNVLINFFFTSQKTFFFHHWLLANLTTIFLYTFGGWNFSKPSFSLALLSCLQFFFFWCIWLLLIFGLVVNLKMWKKKRWEKKGWLENSWGH